MQHHNRLAASLVGCGMLAAAGLAGPAAGQCSEEVHSKLIGSDLGRDAHFGRSVCLNGDLMIIGAPITDDHAGTALIYRFDGAQWTEEARLVTPDIPNEEYWAFGMAVAIEDDLAVVAASKPDG